MKVFDDYWPDVLFYVNLTTTPENPLALNDRLVYSALVHLLKYPRLPFPKSVAGVGEMTGLDPRTVRKCLDRLSGEFKLSEELEPREPPAKWYQSNPAGHKGGWAWGIYGYPVPILADGSPITPSQAALYGLICSLSGDRPGVKGLTRRYLALLLANFRGTVASDLDELERLGLVQVYQGQRVRDSFAVKLYRPSPEHVAYFAQTVGADGDDDYGGFTLDDVKDWPDEEDPWASLIVAADPTNRDAYDCVRRCLRVVGELRRHVPVSPYDLRDRVEAAAGKHVPTAGCKHPGHLLRADLEAELNRLTHRHKRNEDDLAAIKAAGERLEAAGAKCGVNLVSEMDYRGLCDCRFTGWEYVKWSQSRPEPLPADLTPVLDLVPGVSVESRVMNYGCRCKATGRAHFITFRLDGAERHGRIDVMKMIDIMKPQQPQLRNTDAD